MAMLRVRCVKCGEWMATGYDLTYEAFRAATLTTHTIECPGCEHTQPWTFDDVDRSVFPEALRAGS